MIEWLPIVGWMNDVSIHCTSDVNNPNILSTLVSQSFCIATEVVEQA